MTKISKPANFTKLIKIIIIVLNTLLVTMAVLSLSSCDHQTEYSTDPHSKEKGRKKIKIRKHEQIWDRVRQNFDINPKNKLPVQQAKVQKYVQQYRGAAETRLGKASPYMYYIVEELEKRDMPGELALLPMIESAFEPQATSHKAAAGLWQFIPSTGRHFGLKQDKWYDGRRDVTASTDAALDYLELLHKQFNNNWMLALAAYNAGEGTIHRAIQKNIRKGKSTHFWDLDLPKETKEYVPKLLALAEVVKNADKHNVSLPPIQNKPYFETVNLKKSVDIKKVAQIADVEVSELKLLNAGYRKLHTHPTKGPQQLLIPVDKVDEVKKTIEQLPETTAVALADLAKDDAKEKTIGKGKIKAKGKKQRKGKSKGKGLLKETNKTITVKTTEETTATTSATQVTKVTKAGKTKKAKAKKALKATTTATKTKTKKTSTKAARATTKATKAKVAKTAKASSKTAKVKGKKVGVK